MKKQRKPIDTGTPFLDQHYEVRLEPVAPNNPAPRRRVVNQRTIDRLAILFATDEKKGLSPDEWSACQKLWRLAYTAGWSGNLESHLRKLQSVAPGTASDGFTDRWDAAYELAGIVKDLNRALGSKKAKMFLSVVVEDTAVTAAATACKLTPAKAVEYFKEGAGELLKIFTSRQ